MKQRTVVDNTCHEVTFRISVLLCNTFLYYINIMYTVQYVHINYLFLNQHLMHLLYIPHYVMFSYAFRRTSAPSSGVSYLQVTFRFPARHLTVKTWSDMLVKRSFSLMPKIEQLNMRLLKMVPTCAETRSRI
jgi:hypothetical protein